VGAESSCDSGWRDGQGLQLMGIVSPGDLQALGSENGHFGWASGSTAPGPHFPWRAAAGDSVIDLGKSGRAFLLQIFTFLRTTTLQRLPHYCPETFGRSLYISFNVAARHEIEPLSIHTSKFQLSPNVPPVTHTPLYTRKPLREASQSTALRFSSVQRRNKPI